MGHECCCVVNCKNNGLNSKCKFYSFPRASYKIEQRKKWIAAVKRKNVDGTQWSPKPHDKICSEHFIGGKKSEEQLSPSYVPTIFPTIYRKKKVNQSQRILTMAEKIQYIKVLHPHQISPMQNQINISPLHSRQNVYATNVKQDKSQAQWKGSSSSLGSNRISQWKNQTQTREIIGKHEMIKVEDIEDLIQASVLMPGKQLESSNTSKNRPIVTETRAPRVPYKDTNLETQNIVLQRCSECFDTITGFVFVCVRCATRACGACDARHTHAAHFVLRAPAHARQSELELVLDKIREALSMLALQTNLSSSSHVPDVDSLPPEDSLPPADCLPPDEKEYEVIKMEVETEEEQIQRPIDPQSTPTEDQWLTFDPTRIPEGTFNPQQVDDALSNTSSATISASSLSEFSSSDSEEQDSLAPKRKLKWTSDMNKHLMRTYLIVSKTEKRQSKIYSRLKQAFAEIFPRIKVTKSQLREQRKKITLKKLVTMADILNLSYERPKLDLTFDEKETAKELSSKGVRLELSKVTSCQVDNKVNKTELPRIETPFSIPRAKDLITEQLELNQYPKIVSVGQYDELVANKTKLNKPNKLPANRPTRKYNKECLNQFINNKSLTPARSGRARRAPDKFMSGEFV